MLQSTCFGTKIETGVCVCVCVCVSQWKKVPDEWQARQATPAILQVSSSKHNAKKITTRVRGPFHQSIMCVCVPDVCPSPVGQPLWVSNNETPALEQRREHTQTRMEFSQTRDHKNSRQLGGSAVPKLSWTDPLCQLHPGSSQTKKKKVNQKF